MDHIQRLEAINARLHQRLAELDDCDPTPRLPAFGFIGYAIATLPIFALLFATLSNLGA